MDTKVCTSCEQLKLLTEYHKHKPAKDGRKSHCKACAVAAEKARRLVPKHRAIQAWHDINKRVKTQPEYRGIEVRMTQEEFVAWATKAFTKWLAAHPTIRPSIDRVEATGHYELSNIRILSLRDNCRRSLQHRNVHAPDGFAWCSTCKKYLVRANFERNAHKPHGLQNRCRVCRKADRIRYKRVKQDNQDNSGVAR